MKKLKFILIMFLLVCTQNQYSTISWITDWSNNGNQWIGGWHIGSTDNYLSGNFSITDYNNNVRKQLFCINPSNGWAGLLNYHNSNWQFNWNNAGNGFIGNIAINDNFTYSFNAVYRQPYHTLLTIKYGSPGVCADMSIFNGTNWASMWTSCTGNINGWILRTDDRIITANFDNSEPSDEILFIRPSGG